VAAVTAVAETETEEALAAATDQDTKASCVEKINFFFWFFYISKFSAYASLRFITI